MFIFEKTVRYCTHLCAHTFTHKNITQKASSGIKKKLFQHLKSISHLSLLCSTVTDYGHSDNAFSSKIELVWSG